VYAFFSAGASMKAKTTERNREIFAAHQAGEPQKQIAETYGIALGTVDHIIRTEKHKLAVSTDSYYRGLRRVAGLTDI
jgi:DNA-binding NarL/FixJ family response regulator